jgi:hypothetical protein
MLDDQKTMWTDLAYVLVALLVVMAAWYLVVPFVYRRGRQVEFRVGRGSGTGSVLGVSGFKLRVRSLQSGTEHTVALTRVRRR